MVKPLESNRLTIIHQWITVAGVPAGLALLAWMLLQIVDTGRQMTTLSVTMGFMQQDIGRHTTELIDIEHSLSKRP